MIDLKESSGTHGQVVAGQAKLGQGIIILVMLLVGRLLISLTFLGHHSQDLVIKSLECLRVEVKTLLREQRVC